jgi:hypothetical protein
MKSLQTPYGGSSLPGAVGTGLAVVACAISYETANNEVLYTVPDNSPSLRLAKSYYKITTAFTGGTDSAIGASASTTGHTTAGDLLGGATGNLEAALTVGFKKGTIGTDLASDGLVVLAPGDTIKFNRIADAFTAGEGYMIFEFVPLDTADLA